MHQAPRPSHTIPLYGGPLAPQNLFPVIEPPKVPHHDRNLSKEYNDIAEEEESEVTSSEIILDEREVVQAINQMETIWREGMIKWYRNDCVYQLAEDSRNSSQMEKCNTTASGMAYSMPPPVKERTAST